MHTCIPTKALWLIFSVHTVGMFVRKEIHKQNLGIHFHYIVLVTQYHGQGHIPTMLTCTTIAPLSGSKRH